MGWLRKVVKKVGKVAKKALPYAAMAAPFIPGVGGMIGTAANAIGGLWSGKDASEGAQTYPVRNEGDPPTGNSSLWDKAGDFMKSATPAVVGGLNYYGQMQTNAANAQQAQKQMDFQNEQTSTAYQRGTADMKAAGLNPMLAYSQGGASSGGGAMATMGNELGAGANSALSAQMTMQQMKGMELANIQQAAETQRTHADTDLLRARRSEVLESIPNHPTNRANTEARTKHTTFQAQNQDLLNQLLADSYKDQLNMYSSAVRAKDAEGELSRARIGEAKGRSSAIEGLGKWVGAGTGATNSASEWAGHKIGQNLPTEYDAREWWNSLKRYGKPQRPGYQ